MKRQIWILLAIVLLATFAAAQANVTLSPKVPSAQERVVIVMLDDGWLNQYTTALPVLQSLNMNATFSIYPQAMDGQWPAFMSWTQVEDLARQGYDVESHTYSHIDLDNVSTTQLNRELSESKQVLQQHGIQSGALIYPYGNSVDNSTVKQATKDAGYLVARGIDNGVVNLGDSQLDYYALNAYSILNSTSMPYFEAILDNVHGSNIGILVYHKVNGTSTDSETVSTANFAQQMTYLHNNNFTVKTLSAVFFDTTPISSTSPTPTPTTSSTATPSPTPTATAIPTPAPTATETPTPTPNPTTQPSPTPKSSTTPKPTAAPTATPHATPTSIPSPTVNATNPPTNQTDETPVVIAVIIVCAVAAVVGAILVVKRRR